MHYPLSTNMLRESAGLKEAKAKSTILEHMEGQTVRYINQEATSCKLFRLISYTEGGAVGLINYLLLTAN